MSISARLLVNVESLNGVETVGNLSRHRTAPIVIPTNGGYTIRYVPAVSGESIGHAYQQTLVDVAKRLGLPVGVYSERGEFIKFSEDEYLKDEGIQPPQSYEDARRFEVDVMLKDIVADVGGFLYTGKIPVKRTSRIQVGYMIPAIESAGEAAALEAQFHVRFLQSKAQKAQREEERRLGQIPYNVEVGSALYTLTIALDIGGVSEPSIKFGKPHPRENDLRNQAKKRREASLLALATMLSSWLFGAKRSRFLPNAELRSAVITLSTVPFIASPGNTRSYAKDTAERASSLVETYKRFGRQEDIMIMAINREGLEIHPRIQSVNTIEQAINKVVDILSERKLL